MSWRPVQATSNGVTPYLDVMTINSAQYPTTIDGKTKRGTSSLV